MDALLGSGATDGATSSDPIAETRLAYQKAAAVLVTFNPSELRPMHADGHADALEQLLDDCVVVYDDQHVPRLSLRDDARVDALRLLQTRENMLVALRDNPARLDTPQQQLFEQYLYHNPPTLDKQTRDQLGMSLQIATWLDGVLPDAPAADEVRQRLNMEGLLQPFRHLADDFFRGRENELGRLHRYARGERASLGGALLEPPPLTVYGLGGVGKSTLIAKFLLELADLPDDERVPFAYLDFDRADIVADEPVTLLIEASRQIGLQLPALRSLCEGLRDLWLRRRLREASGTTKQPARKQSPFYQSGVLGSSHSSIEDETRSTIDEFVNIFASAPLGETHLLLILDTFEEVQKRSADIVQDLWAFLQTLQESLPQLRPVIVGRVPLDNYATTRLPLDVLDPEAAREFLVARGKLSPELASVVVEQVGCSPLSLRLATDLLQRERDAGHDISQGVQFDRFVRAMKDYDLQGQLYWRILDHVGRKDDLVRKLAHPGLILRKITPELIRDVLAEPCNLSIASLDQAQELFDRLQRLVDLVYSPAMHVLMHRPEVRKVMLDMLRRDREHQVKAIHQRAVVYYTARTGVEDRAEELYHRLALEESRAVLDKRWLPGVERSLEDSAAELPVSSQNYLAGRMRLNLSPDVVAQAELVDWERQAAPHAQERLDKGQPGRALDILRERRERSEASPIYLLEAQVLQRLARDAEARAVLEAGIAAHSRRGGSRALLELLLEGARLAERSGALTEALQDYIDAAELAERYGTPRQRLQAGLGSLRVASAQPVAPDASAALAALFERIPDAELQQDPPLLRDSAEVLGQEQVGVLRRALRLHGTEGAGRRQIEALARSRAAWDQALAAQGEDEASLASVAGVYPFGDAQSSWNRFLTEMPSLSLAAALDPLLERQPVPPDVRRALIDLLRAQDLYLVPGREYRKNARQVRALSGDAFKLTNTADDTLFGSSPTWLYRAFTLRRHEAGGTSDEGVVVRTVYLFNLLVAWGWIRSNDEQHMIERALRGASDLIYQRSGGQIALGQAIFGGTDLAAFADLHILPVERMEPSSSPPASHNMSPTPIRVGRSLPGANGSAQEWDTPAGHAALADVWLEYAKVLAATLVSETQPPELLGVLRAPQSGAAEVEELPLVLPRFRHFGGQAARVGLLTSDEGERLVDLLLQLPDIIHPVTRQVLIRRLPPALQQSVSLSRNARNDIRLLVDVVEGQGAQLADGRWPVELVIREALSLLQGESQLAVDLQRLLDTALARLSAPADAVNGPAAPLALSGPQLKEFQEALLSAFASYSDLSQMVYFGMGESLDQITSDHQVLNATYELITWATAEGRIAELIGVARAANKSNPRLRAFAQKMLGS